MLGDDVEELPEENDDFPLAVVADDDVRPFRNAVPFYDDLGAALARLADEMSEGVAQEDERLNPHDYVWVELKGRTTAQKSLFVGRMPGEAMNLRIPPGAFCLFRLMSRAPREGQVVAARHPEVDDTDLGGDVTVRIYETSAASVGSQGEGLRVILRPASAEASYVPFVLEAEDGFRIVAELVEIVG